MRLAGKSALVTGGSRGIGAAIVRRLAEDGAEVAFSFSASPDKADALVGEIATGGGRAVAFKADQADPEQAAALVRRAHRHFGKLDILVNNAGIGLRGRVDEPMEQADLDRLFAINLRGVSVCVRTAAPLLRDGGRIISIGSVNGSRVPQPGLSDYSATKAAVAGYTRGWARDLGPSAITVNIVQPGATITDMVPETGPNALRLAQSAALGRMGQPHEIAAAVAFLASDDASFVTGATLTVDGGQIT